MRDFTMQQVIEKHSVGLLFGLISIFAVGFIDMRVLVTDAVHQIKAVAIQVDNVEKKVDTVTTISTGTRTEQLLRTDEIDYVNELRKIYPDWNGSYIRKKK